MAPLGFAEAGHGRDSAVRHSILMLRPADARHQDSRCGRGTREGSETIHRRAVSLFQHDQGARRGCSTRRSVTRLGDA